jgi:hypothetical protein
VQRAARVPLPLPIAVSVSVLKGGVSLEGEDEEGGGRGMYVGRSSTRKTGRVAGSKPSLSVAAHEFRQRRVHLRLLLLLLMSLGQLQRRRRRSRGAGCEILRCRYGTRTVHDVRPGVGVGMSVAARACWVAEGWGICVRHRRKGSKRVCGEEDDAGKRVAGRCKCERHCVPDL